MGSLLLKIKGLWFLWGDGGGGGGGGGSADAGGEPVGLWGLVVVIEDVKNLDAVVVVVGGDVVVVATLGASSKGLYILTLELLVITKGFLLIWTGNSVGIPAKGLCSWEVDDEGATSYELGWNPPCWA